MSIDEGEVLPVQATDMEDLPMKPASSGGSTAKMVKPAVVRKPRAPTKHAQSMTKRPVKPIHKQEQPRDNLGRFARKTGAVLWGATKATAKGSVKAVKGTVKTVKKTHKAVKRFHSGVQRRARLEERERKIALAEREMKLGLRKKKTKRKKA